MLYYDDCCIIAHDVKKLGAQFPECGDIMVQAPHHTTLNLGPPITPITRVGSLGDHPQPILSQNSWGEKWELEQGRPAWARIYLFRACSAGLIKSQYLYDVELGKLNPSSPRRRLTYLQKKVFTTSNL